MRHKLKACTLALIAFGFTPHGAVADEVLMNGVHPFICDGDAIVFMETDDGWTSSGGANAEVKRTDSGWRFEDTKSGAVGFLREEEGRSWVIAGISEAGPFELDCVDLVDSVSQVVTLIKPRLDEGIVDTQRRLAEKSAELSALREKYDQLDITLNTKLRQQADKFEAELSQQAVKFKAELTQQADKFKAQMSLNKDAARPIRTYAQPFEDLDAKPLMSIVLIDTGNSDLGVEALDAFPYPLTFAVDTSQPDATERMQVYREKGFEVLALVDLPRSATPSDVEIAMSAHLSAVPEAVGVMEGVDTGVQASREILDQLTQIVLSSGHGMVFQRSGMNTARKLAEREGIPAGTVFRDFDGNNQSASVMRRFLDQAAFSASREGGVIMMGRLQAETISALLIWGLADRSARVSLSPVSAVLLSKKIHQGK